MKVQRWSMVLVGGLLWLTVGCQSPGGEVLKKEILAQPRTQPEPDFHVVGLPGLEEDLLHELDDESCDTYRSPQLSVSLDALTAFCGLAAAKLRATPKFDRVQEGADLKNMFATMGEQNDWEIIAPCRMTAIWEIDEGRVELKLEWKDIPWDGMSSGGSWRVADKRITRRSPLERLAWLAGWR